MPSQPREIDRQELSRAKRAWVHEGRRILQADVLGYEIGDTRIVVKDFARRPWFIRWFWGRWVLRREWRRLEQLQGIDGVPRLLGWVDCDAFAMEWIDAQRLPHRKDNQLGPEFFDRLRLLVEQMHARGVGHGDLRRKNILVGSDGKPHLVDFATAFVLGPSRRSRCLFEKICEIDRLTVLKLKEYYCPESLTESERSQLEAQPVALRIGRILRKKVYRPLKPRRLRRRWTRLRRFLFGQPSDED